MEPTPRPQVTDYQAAIRRITAWWVAVCTVAVLLVAAAVWYVSGMNRCPAGTQGGGMSACVADD